MLKLLEQRIRCPYCGESIDVLIDASEPRQHYIEDCQVCCSPMRILVRVGIEEDIKTTDYGSMLATAEDVGIFLRALNDGSLFAEGEQEIYSSIYEYDHTGLIPGYQSIAKYHEDIDAVLIQFTNTTDFEGYKWNLSEIVYSRIVKILRNK